MLPRMLPIALFVCASLRAQIQEPAMNGGAAAAWQALLRLRTTATVLHVTAHPDDEDGALLTWLTRSQGVRTGLLTLNRGEGGANLIGPELYDALGIVRTEELLAAGRYYGVDQFFTRVVDFGFSKRLDETLEHWGHESVLRDAVRVIRLYRPDVLVARFHGAPRDGHGNHQAAGRMSFEALHAAADPARFPEQFAEGLRPWRVKKLYLEVRENEPHTLRIDTGRYDPLLGASYREIAREGLNFQRSQGAGQVRAPRGPSYSYLQLAESTGRKPPSESGIFDGVDTSLAPLRNFGAEEIAGHVEAAIAAFDARRPWLAAPHLARGLRATRNALAALRAASLGTAAKDTLLFLLTNKEREFACAANHALGISLDAVVDPGKPATGPFAMFQPRETFAVAIPGQRFTLTSTASNRGEMEVGPVELELRVPAGWRVADRTTGLQPMDRGVSAQFEVLVPDDAASTRPYWSRASELRDHVYAIRDPRYLNLPFAPPEVMARFVYRLEGVELSVERPAQTQYIDRLAGEQRRLLTVAPAVSVAISPRVGVIPSSGAREEYPLRAVVMSNVKGPARVRLRLQLPAGWASAPAEAFLDFTHEGEIQSAAFEVSIPPLPPGRSATIRPTAEFDGKTYTEGYQVIAHPGLEPRHLYRPAEFTLQAVDVTVKPGLKVGYVMGVGDEVPQALEQLGVQVRMLGPQDLASASLSGFDAILVGIRASAVRNDLKAYNRRLLDYVERGGHLIVQYQTQEFDAVPYGPYPFRLSPNAEEVSEEDARVTVLDPANPLFHAPNRITAADFEGWVEERGSKFMSEWDARYKPLLECHDRAQAPQRGGLLQAEYGRGTYTYCAYAFYRQLPAGVAGAYRLFANLISLGR